MNALVVIDTLTPAVYSEPNGIDALISKLETEVRSTPTDISTPAGRKAVASLAHKIARSKTALDSIGKELGAEWKAKAKLIDTERAKAWDRLEALQAEVRKPLTDWEDAEKDRIADHEAALAAMEGNLTFDSAEPSSTDIRERLDASDQPPVRHWEEFAKRASEIRDRVRTGLMVMLTTAEKREAAAAELARLRAEQAAREQQEREDRIAAEAADKAQLIAEAKAAREAEEAASRAAEIQRKADQERAAAVAQAEQAERDRQEVATKAERRRIEDHERALRSVAGMIEDACSPFNGGDLIQRISDMIDTMSEMTRDWEEFADRFAETLAAGKRRIADRLTEARSNEERRAKEMVEKAARDRQGAAEDAERRRLAAIETERRQVADTKAAEEAATAKREANRRHRAKIESDVFAGLRLAGLDENQSALAVSALSAGKIPHTRIAF